MFIERGSYRSVSLVKGVGPDVTFRRRPRSTRPDGLHRYVSHPPHLLSSCHSPKVGAKTNGQQPDSPTCRFSLDSDSELTIIGPNSLFIRILLDKKYALPYKTVDALVFHFIRLANSPRSKDGDDKLPVLWHQSLLVFVQRSVPVPARSLTPTISPFLVVGTS